MHKKDFIQKGRTLNPSSRVLIMIHGRGGSAEDILSLADHLEVSDFTLVAPAATNHTWYPYSFMAPVSANEPWLGSAIQVINEIVQDLESAGIKKENIFFLGFSQGACLTLEYTARYAARYGGIIAFTGGLIGDRTNTGNYSGNFSGTPLFIGTSDPDPHVPVERVNESATIMQTMGAAVTKKIYKGMGHTISQDEVTMVNELLFKGREILNSKR